jgi:hypothetical protein
MPQRYPGAQAQMSVPVPQLQFVAPPLPTESVMPKHITAPLPEPLYLPVKRQPRNRFVRILLLASGIFFLLATCIMVYMLLGKGSVGKVQPGVPTKTAVQQTSQLHAPPNLQLSASQIDFGTGAPGVISSKPIILKNAGGGQIYWQAGSDSSWLTISPSGGIFSSSMITTLKVNRANSTPGNHTGYITFIQQGNTYSTLKVTMAVSPYAATVTVSPPPTVTVGPPPIPVMVITTKTLAFSAIKGNNPAPQTFAIANTGNALLNWATIEDANAAAFAPLSPSRGVVTPGQKATITVKPSIASSSAGVITGHITISDTDKGTSIQSQQVTVTITISNQAVISLSNASLSFSLTNTNQLLVITNSGSAPLNWTLSQPLPSWLSVDIPGGTLSPGMSTFVTVTCTSTGLAVGTYTYNLVVSDTDANTPVTPQNVTITMTVT